MFDIIFTLSYAPIPTLTKLSAKLFFFFSLGHSVVLKSRLSKIGIATSLNCWFSSAQYCSL